MTGITTFMLKNGSSQVCIRYAPVFSLLQQTRMLISGDAARMGERNACIVLLVSSFEQTGFCKGFSDDLNSVNNDQLDR